VGKPLPRRAPPSFNEEPTREVDDHVMAVIRSGSEAEARKQDLAQATSGQDRPLPGVRPASPLPNAPLVAPAPLFLGDRASLMPQDPAKSVDPYDETGVALSDDLTPNPHIDQFLAQAPSTDPRLPAIEDHQDGFESTQLDEGAAAAFERYRLEHGRPTPGEEKTRAVSVGDTRRKKDIDWDLESEVSRT
jgi:hypothetical protein